MRISTNTFYESATSRLGDLQATMARTQQQLSTGRRILTPADDPVASSQALDVTQAQAVNAQFSINRQNAKASLEQEDSTLASVTLLLQDVKVLTVNAGNATLSDADRSSLATALSGRVEELMGLANTRDGLGNYLFAGYQNASPAFTRTPAGAQYQGDQGQRFLQVGASRQLAMSDSGDAVFERNRSVAVAAPTAAPLNTGTGAIANGSIANAALVNGHAYQVSFTSATTYDVFDTTAGGPALSTGNAYTSGQTITVGGMQFDISGGPLTGDTFSVASQSNQSVFAGLTDLITLLQTPGTAALTKGLALANGNVDQALDNVLTVRASVGSRLKELEALDYAGDDRDIQYQQTLSNLQDLDYVKAITTLSQQQFTLEAAQQSFIKIQGLSLFNFLR